METKVELENRGRATDSQCSACRDRKTEINQANGIGVPQTFAEDQADNHAPNPQTLVTHIDQDHETEIRRWATVHGLSYVGGEMFEKCPQFVDTQAATVCR